MQRTLLTSLLAILCTTPALADGLDKGRVPASAKAIVHIDVEALANSQIARKVEELHPEADVDLDLGQHHPMLSGLRPLRDVRSVTIFTSDSKLTGDPHNQKVGALVRCNSKIDALLDMGLGVEQYELAELDGWKVHSWREGQDQVFGAVLPLGESDERLALVSNDPSLMKEGMAVLQGRGRSMAQGATGQLGTVPERGAILYVATDTPLSALSEIDPSSPVVQLVQGFSLQFGESQGRVFANLSLSTQDPRNAQRVQQVLQGLTALASLATENGVLGDEVEPEQAQILQQLVSAVRFQTTGNLLYVEFGYDLEQLIRDVQALEHH